MSSGRSSRRGIAQRQGVERRRLVRESSIWPGSGNEAFDPATRVVFDCSTTWAWLSSSVSDALWRSIGVAVKSRVTNETSASSGAISDSLRLSAV